MDSDGSLSSLNYSASSLIKLAQNFVNPPEQHRDIPQSSSASTPNSSYGYESLLEMTAAGRWKTSTVSHLTQRSPSKGTSSQHSPVVRARGAGRGTLQGATTPEDVSLSGENDYEGPPTRNPLFPIENCDFGTRKYRPESSTSDESSEVNRDLYEPPPRSSAARTSVHPASERTPTPLSTYDQIQMDPRVWYFALSDLNQLKSGSWISATSIDIWLSDLWRNKYRKPVFRYIPTTFIQPAQNAPSQGEEDRQQIHLSDIKRFRSLFDDLPQSEDPCELENFVCVLVIGGNHYCTLVFTPGEERIHILGRRISANRRIKGTRDWDDWGGPRIWARVCKLYGWSPTQFPGLTVNSVDWVQNGVDCGPISCQVVENLWIRGLSLDGDGLWRSPNLPCCHSLRRNMAIKVYQLAVDGYKAFIASKRTPYRQQMSEYLDGEIDDWKEFENEIGSNLSRHPSYALSPVDADLRKAISACWSCKKRLSASAPISKAKSPHPIHPLLQGTTSRKDCIISIDEEEIISKDCDAGEHDCRDKDSSENESDGDVPRKVFSTSGIFQVGDWTQARIGRFPRPKNGPILPALCSLRGLRHEFSDDYDNYTDGPTLDVLDPIPDTVMQLAQVSLVYIANKVITTPWRLFDNDYGYRLLPDFAQMSWLTKPILVREHLSPVGLLNPQPAFAIHNPPTTSRTGLPIIPHDRIVLGAEEMLELADSVGNDLLLLTGMVEDGSYVYLDLEKDRVDPQQISKACDIDSLVWITRKPKFIGSIGIYEMPVIRKKPPIWKNNHIMVELLFPQSEDDKLRCGPRTEWQTKPFRLSRIPHLSFGVLAQSTSVVELLLFFPRMTHRHPHLGRWENGIPSDIQNFFWDRVLLPAMKGVRTSTQEPYVTLDREHTAFKQKHSGRKNMGQATAKHPLHTDDLTVLIELMEDIIEEGSGSLDHFGSFFFVVQVKGSKGLSQVEGTTLGSSLRLSFSRLQETFGGLDFPYMEDRNNGELIVDIGVTIQPQNDRPLVGLWRLDCLEASFGAAGFLSGNIHTLNTFSLYGGLQAESPDLRCKRTQVVFRNTYTLPYEATRQRDNSRDIFQEKDVYQQNKTFHKELEGVRNIFQNKAPSNSYGVRDEFRVGASAMRQMMDFADDMVSEFIDSHPILWLPSDVWFNFLDRRLGILADTQAKLYARRPPNYGVLSGLFAYLMQSVLFTPPLVNTFVRESLAALEYKRHCNSDGMFFLHTFDLTKDSCLEEILQVDDSSIKRLLGDLKKPGVVFSRGLPEGEDDGDITYPLGRTPTWAEIVRSLESNPFELMAKWSFPAQLEHYIEAEEDSIERQACKIFIKFTRGLWVIVNPLWMKPEFRRQEAQNIQPKTIQEALELWSVDSICEKWENLKFRACNSGFREVSGRPTLSFADRFRLYFPDEDEEIPRKWQLFSEESGYLHLYHTATRGLGTDDTRELNRCLGDLLSHCQCLPDSALPESRGNIWRVEGHRMILLANPNHFLIRGVGSTKRVKRNAGNRATRAPAAHRPQKDAMVQWLIQEGYEAACSARSVALKTRSLRAAEKRKVQRKSVKKKKAREPPRRKNKKRISDSEGIETSEEEEAEEDEAEDEDEGDEEEQEDDDDDIEL